MSRRKCGVCDDRGVLAPALPSCRVAAAKLPWIVVERCDSCDRFEDDLTAALSVFSAAGWFQCDHSGWHALADTRTMIISHGSRRCDRLPPRIWG
jgi:hypothetical protein